MKKPSMFRFFYRYWFQISFIGILLFSIFLRLYQLHQELPTLYWEEAALGYDAYSILKTGKDHHGQAFPVVAFRSFGDYKPSGYFYAVVPFEAVLGLTPLAVRLPSATAGIFMVIGISFLVRQVSQYLWPKKGIAQHQRIQLLALGFAACSPWLLQFSRAGWEVNLASTLLLWAVLFRIFAFKIESIKKQTALLLLSALLAVASMYTYHATRVVTPLVIACLDGGWLFKTFWIHRDNLKLFVQRILAPLLLSAGTVLVLLAPLILQVGNTSTQQRFAETSITADGQYVQISNQLRQLDHSPFAMQFSHRYFVLAGEVLTGFVQHFSPQFLFVTGDQNPRHSVQFFGLFYPTDIILFGIGGLTLASLFWRKKQSREVILFLLFWLCIGILPAAITKATPHALRILPTAPVFFILLSIGAETGIQWLSRNFGQYKRLLYFFIGSMFMIFSVEFLAYWKFSTLIYPTLFAADWQFGYQQLVQILNDTQKKNPGKTVSVTREYGRPAMYYWFFSKTPPSEVQAEQTTASQDQGEFLQFKQLRFINTVNEAKEGVVASSKAGFTQLQQQFSSVELLSEVKDPRGKTVWVVSLVSQSR